MGGQLLKLHGNLNVLRQIQSAWFKFNDGNQSELLNVSIDPSEYGLDAPKGSLAIRDDVASLYLKQDDGDTTNWKKISGLTILNSINELELTDSQEIIFVNSVNTFYKYDDNNTSIVNNEQIVATKNGGNTRWVAVAGYKSIPERVEKYNSTLGISGFQYSGGNNTSGLLYNESTREFTLSVSGNETIWYKSVPFLFDSDLSITVPNIEGRHYIYLGQDNTMSGDVTIRSIHSSLLTDDLRKNIAFIATIYVDITNNRSFIKDERHSASLPSTTRFIEHTSRGSILKRTTNILSAVELGVGNNIAHSQVALSSFQLIDEDIKDNFIGNSLPASVSMFYKISDNVRWDVPSNVLVKTHLGQACVNTNGNQVTVDDGKFFCTHIIATGAVGDKQVIAIQGTSTYLVANDAHSSAYSEISSILEDGEYSELLDDAVVIGTVVFEASQSYVGKARVVKNWLNEDVLNWADNNYNIINKARNAIIGTDSGDTPVTPTVKANTRSVSKVASSITLDYITHDVVWVTTESNVNITLPPPSLDYQGLFFTIKKTKDLGEVAVIASVGSTIDGDDEYHLLSGNKASITVQTDGLEWMVI